MKCPVCGEECEQPTVDVGVGEIPCGPLACENCHWVEDEPEIFGPGESEEGR